MMGNVKLSKVRLDRLLVERGLAETRAKAQAIILAGDVLIDEQKVTKCGAPVSAAATIRLLGQPGKYAGRAGWKLEGALDHFGINPRGKTCLDIGASSGGFTDCLLQRGAELVIAVDVNVKQLDWRLRTDVRVRPVESNARYLTLAQVGKVSDLATVDVSFISVTLILPVLPPLLKPESEILVLVKPQFEVGRGQVEKGGVVRDPRLHRQTVDKASRKLFELGFTQVASAESVLPGAEGNREYFVHGFWQRA